MGLAKCERSPDVLAAPSRRLTYNELGSGGSNKKAPRRLSPSRTASLDRTTPAVRSPARPVEVRPVLLVAHVVAGPARDAAGPRRRPPGRRPVVPTDAALDAGQRHAAVVVASVVGAPGRGRGAHRSSSVGRLVRSSLPAAPVGPLEGHRVRPVRRPARPSADGAGLVRLPFPTVEDGLPGPSPLATRLGRPLFLAPAARVGLHGPPLLTPAARVGLPRPSL
mmetsp:Transcript_5525/g.12562  ORF Transcript_5525/g.12562 Transcript_5525/m.12562 type:complete len:222 (+) Transcript_5525:71-736(+)